MPALSHGESTDRKISAELSTWYEIHRRCCCDPKKRRYKRYGGRGIKVCERWHTFENFLADMGRRPGAGYSIERNDNDGNYSPENCRWATAKEQSRNRSDNHFITIGSRSLPIAAWAEEVGIDQKLILCRIVRGWTSEAAVLVPPGQVRGKDQAKTVPRANAIGAALALALLAACATPTPPVPTVKTCPAITSYTPAQEAQASAELKALPAGDILGVFITDYSQLRAEVRACQAG